MKITRLLIILLFIILFFLFLPSYAQDINVQEMIGKKLDTVIKTYGKPVHQDRSNPSMECIFYKSNVYQMVFVANQEGVFQAEGSKAFNSNSSAQKALHDLLAKCQSQDYKTDTINVAEFNLNKPGVRMNISVFENTYSKKYEVKVKANKSAD